MSHPRLDVFSSRRLLTCCEREGDVDDQSHVGDIQSSSCDIRGHEDVDFSLFELFQRLEPGRLVQIAMQSNDSVSPSSDGELESLGFFLVQRKDEDTRGRSLGGRVGFQVLLEVVHHPEAKQDQQTARPESRGGYLLLVPRAVQHLDNLLDPLVRTQLVTPDGHFDRVSEERARQSTDGFWPCRRD